MLISGLKSYLLILLQWQKAMIKEIPHLWRGDKKLYLFHSILFCKSLFPPIKQRNRPNSRYLITNLKKNKSIDVDSWCGKALIHMSKITWKLNFSERTHMVNIQLYIAS